jgi:ATP adenylyltransferase
MNSLKDFIQNKMRMSHIYQPLMIKTLIANRGEASKHDIAKKIVEFDFSQVEYYEKVVDSMIGQAAD